MSKKHMRPLLRLCFATRKSGLENSRPFLERSEEQNAYIAQRFDLSKYNILLTEKDPDYLIILNRLNYDLPSPRERTIGVVTEPSWSGNYRPDYLNDRCAVVLSHVETGLNACTSGHSLAVPWVTRNDYNGVITKTKKMSLIASPLNPDEPGTNYQFRHDLVGMILDSDLDCDIFGDWAGDDPRLKGEIANKADALLPYEFSIAIENICEPGYATEKLLDCLLTETQPVYLGDPIATESYGSNAITLLSPTRPLDVLKEIQCGTVRYDADAVKTAKSSYLNTHNLIAQLSDLIKQNYSLQAPLQEASSMQTNRHIQKSATGGEALISTVLTGDVTDQILDLFKEAGSSTTTLQEEAISVELNLETAAEALDTSTGAHLVVIYTPPEQYIAKAIAAGVTITSATSACQAYIENILKIYRLHRRRVTLLESQATLLDPVAALKAVEDRTGRALANDKAHTSWQPNDSVDSFAIILAACNLLEDHDLKLATKELQAGSAFTTHNSDKQPLSVRLEELRAEQIASQEEASQNETENELLLLQLHQIQEELESYFSKCQALEASLNETRADGEKHLHTVKQTEEALKSSRQKNSAQQDKLSGLQEELALTKNKLGSSRKTAAALKQSISWKITSPVRGLLGLFVGSEN